MKTVLFFSKIADSRIAILISALFYASAIHYAHIEYLNPVWNYYGFTYRPIDIFDIFFIIVLVIFGGVFIPLRVKKPSSIILLLLFLVVYIPSIVITMGLDSERISLYGANLISLAFGFSLSCYVVKNDYKRQEIGQNNDFNLPKNLSNLFLVLWFLFCIILIYVYHSIMGFADLDSIYQQRELGVSSIILINYIKSYLSNVISPALIAIGLRKKQWGFIIVGTIGCIIVYMISAQRTVFLLPFTIIIFHFLLTRAIPVFKSSILFIVMFGTIVLLVTRTYKISDSSLFLGIYFVFRTLCLPGLCFSQYMDLFGFYGFTFWSHVTGLNLIIPTPSSYINDPLWPNLGYMIGDRIYNASTNNANANLFAGDGVAAAGFFGVIIISLVFAFWISFLDRVSKKWDKIFSILVIFPVALSLTNGHFFTTMISFGGLFWTIVFFVYKPKT